MVGHLSSDGHSHTYNTPFGLALTKKFPANLKESFILSLRNMMKT